MTFSPIRSTGLRAEVVAQIRQAIIEGALLPGDHIVEKTLTDQLGVSRTPVREALIVLESEGLLVSTTHRGSFVRTFAESDVIEIFTMRTALENLAAELIIDRFDDNDITSFDRLIQRQREAIDRGDFRSVRTLDMEFHKGFIVRTGHALLKKNWDSIVAQIAALLYMRAEALTDFDEYQALSHHQAILDAYKEHDLARVQTANRRINEWVAQDCLRSIGLRLVKS